MATALTLTLNGVERSFDDLADGSTADLLVAALGFRADRVAMELNGDILPRASWQGTLLKAGDRVELVHFVGGGTGHSA